jgi:hypothetical protein
VVRVVKFHVWLAPEGPGITPVGLQTFNKKVSPITGVKVASVRVGACAKDRVALPNRSKEGNIFLYIKSVFLRVKNTSKLRKNINVANFS